MGTVRVKNDDSRGANLVMLNQFMGLFYETFAELSENL